MKVWDLHCDTLYELRRAEKAAHPKAFCTTICISTLKNCSRGIICCNALRPMWIWPTPPPGPTRW